MKEATRKLLRSPSTWLIAASALLLVAIIVLGIVFWQPLSEWFGDKERVKAFVQDAGVWGPLVFIGIQFLQILIAPIPGQAVGVLAGALFGPVLGTVYSMAGALLGFTTIFIISRQLGRPFVERFVKKEHLEKFDYLTKANGAMVFFIIFLLPAFPDDIICYLAGLSPIPIRTLVLVSFLGRLPGFMVLSFIGSGIADADMRLIIAFVTIFVVIGALAYWQRKRLEEWVRSLGGSPDGTSRK